MAAEGDDGYAVCCTAWKGRTMSKLLMSVPIKGPDERRVRVLFYDDGSIRFRVTDAAPMKLAEAFLRGRDSSVIVKLDPDVPSSIPGGDMPLDQLEEQREIIEMLRAHDEIGAFHRTRQLAELLRIETLAFARTRLEDRSFGEGAGASKYERSSPVWSATLAALGPRMRQYTSAVATLIEYAPERVTDAVIPITRLFDQSLPTGIRTATELPRLVAGLVGMTLLAYAIALRRYPLIAAICRPRAKSHRGLIPWLLAPEIHHPESLARDATVFADVLLEHLRSESTGELAVSAEELANAALAADVIVGVLAVASDDRGVYCWAVSRYADRIEPAMRDLASDREALAGCGQLVGESASAFASAFPTRYGKCVAVVERTQDTYPLDQRVLALFTSAADTGNTR